MVTCKAFLLDLDGTLIDSYPDAEQCWTDWARSVGAVNNFEFAKLYGRRRTEIILATLPGLSKSEVAMHAEQVRLAEREYTDNIVALPGAMELLSYLPESAWAIVTSNDREVAQARIRAAGLPMPRVLFGETEVKRGKPDPQGLLLAASALNTEAKSAVAIDDSPLGIEAASRAEMSSVAVRFRQDDRSLHKANFIIDNLSFLSVKKNSTGFTVSPRL